MRAPINQRFDAIVIGVGGMGSSVAYHLARRGRRVLGLERFDVPNDMGSSHGVTRIIRLAYYEHSSYVPLLRRSYELWRQLEQTAGERLLHVTGSVDAGPSGSAVFEGSLRSCIDHGLPHEVLTGGELTRRFPGYRLPPDTMALFQPDGGFLLPERCIVAHVEAAQKNGAEIHGREPVIERQSTADGVRVRTTRATYEGDRLIVTAGAWAGTIARRLERLAVPERQVLGWLQPGRPELFHEDRFPVFNVLVDEGRYYGFPIFGVPGFKIGRYHHRGETTNPDFLDRECHDEDELILRSFAERYFPDGAGPTMSLKTCMFTNSPDEHFIVDVDPDQSNVVYAAGFSGHGFKFCSVIGEILADLSDTGSTRHDIGLFTLSRFAEPPVSVEN